MKHEAKPLRDADVYGPDYAIWYGPEGEEGDIATVVSRISYREFIVAEIRDVTDLIEDIPEEGPFLIISTVVELDEELVEGLDERRDERTLLGIAASIGISKISEEGGREEWASSLQEAIDTVV